MGKRIFLVLLALTLALSSVACGGKNSGPSMDPAGSSEEQTDPEQTDVDGIFKVGYARVNITPEGDGYPLAGFGRTDQRLSNGLLDYQYVTAIAYVDEVGTKFVMFTFDMISTALYYEDVIASVSNELGVPTDNILVSATHSHSSVDCETAGKFPIVQAYKERLAVEATKAATEAFADAKPAKMYWNTEEIKYNYVRHYYDENGLAVGDNHNSGDAWGQKKLVKHTSEANHVMYMVKFVREGGEDILLCNWRAHATLTGSSTKTDLSADYVGSVRTNIEKATGCKFAYFQGEAGNMNPKTRLEEALEHNTPTDYKEYGKEVSALIEGAYKRSDWEEIPEGKIVTVHEQHMTDTNHSREELLKYATDLYEVYKAEGWTDTVTKQLQAEGLFSPFQCYAIKTNAKRAPQEPCSLHATCIGDLILVNEQSEMFDTNGTYVRDNSPSKFTIVMSYTEGNGYIPSQYAYDYGCYEADCARFAPGSGEVLADRLLEMANDLWKKK